MAMTHVIHFLCLLAAYLDVPLPCPITCKSNNPSKFFITGVGIGGVVSGGSTTLNDVSSSSSSSSSPCPLYVTDDNMDRFLMGVAMLNVNVSALAHGQGVYLVTNSNTTGGDGGVKLTPALLLDTLAHLALCCQSRFLGR